jgi:nucleoside-diphosphate-sugar epimerase
MVNASADRTILQPSGLVTAMKNLNIVVTGGAGKLGKWVVAELLAHSHQVTVFDRVRTPDNAAARYIVGDIVDLGQVLRCFGGGGCRHSPRRRL